MRKIRAIIFAILMICMLPFGLCACGEDNSLSDEEAVAPNYDYNFVAISDTITAAKLNTFEENPTEYEGNTIKIKGISLTSGSRHYLCSKSKDTMGCCQLWTLEYESVENNNYPDSNKSITLTGEWKKLESGYYGLSVTKIKINS